MSRARPLLLGALATVAVAELFHGPLGAAAELETRIERQARVTLDFWELPQVTAELDTKPLNRRLILNGPADEFQRRAVAVSLATLPGVHEVRWQAGSPVIVHQPGKAAR